MSRIEWIDKIKQTRFPKETGMTIVAAIVLLAGTSGGVSPSPPPGPGPWTPKWAVGDLLKSYSINATWIVKQIDYSNRQYYCEFTFAGSTQFIWIDAAALEDPNIYKAV